MAEVLLEAREAVLEKTEAAAAAEDVADAAEDDTAEEGTEDNTFDPAWRPEIAEEEEVGGIVLPDGAFFAASIICNVSTAFGAVPADLARRVSDPLRVITVAITIVTSVVMISRTSFLIKHIFA